LITSGGSEGGHEASRVKGSEARKGIERETTRRRRRRRKKEKRREIKKG
jgi:hypothetical protein